MFIDPTAEELDEHEPRGARAPRARVEADPEDGRDAHRHVRRAAPVPRRGAHRRHVLRGRDQEVDLHADERPAAARGRPADALLCERRRRTATWRCSSASRAPGKTTLSADPTRHLIGDDEHGWGDHGVFNIEGGCYAKVISLSAEAEPEIFKHDAHVRDGARERRRRRARRARPRRRLEDGEHARARTSWSRSRMRCRRSAPGIPATVVFLTADAFGILPPIARLTRDAGAVLVPLRVHGEARGDGDRRQGAAADVLRLLRRAVPAAAAGGLRAHAGREARARTSAAVWLVNTGWTGGPFGEGHRMPIHATRALLHAALSGRLDRRRVPRGPGLRLRGAGRRAGRGSSSARPTRDLGRPGGVRRQGARARADVPGQLHALRGRWRSRRGGGPARLTCRATAA